MVQRVCPKPKMHISAAGEEDSIYPTLVVGKLAKNPRIPKKLILTLLDFDFAL